MKFGALPEQLLSTVDLRLPPEPAANDKVLPGKRVDFPKVYVGAASWGHNSWTGNLYPPKTPATRYRQLYPQYFNTIELNATHYNIYSVEVMEDWAASAKGKDFKFCPKFPQQISHYSNFQHTDSLTEAFLESVSAFGDNLGPIFLQVSEYFSPSSKNALFQYLASLPTDLTFFLEVRHPDWFANAKEREALFSTLHELNIGAVITDTPGRRDIVHMHVTIPKLMLRFVCNAAHSTSFTRTDAWVQQIKKWINTGLEEAYIFLHPGDETVIPELTTYWIQALNSQASLQLKLPTPTQPSLF
jgi:uncharacterized protein YecE (DUF72 family)